MKLERQNQDKHFGESDVVDTGVEKRAVKAYEKPILIAYGDVRDITLGPTFGEGESGCAFLYRVGPGGCP